MKLRNLTLTVARCAQALDHRGAEVAVVVVKRTYAVSPEGSVRLGAPPSPIRAHDVLVSDARTASLKYPHDLSPEKPGTDVLLVGTAHPPRPRLKYWRATLAVKGRHALVQKTLDLYGPRVWTRSGFSIVPGAPAEAGPTPLVYELSYGGIDDGDPHRWEERNPAGTGFLRRPSSVGRPAPVIEDPRAPLSSSSPAPAGFGPIQPHWHPRRRHAGTFDDDWLRTRAPLPPADFDPRHYACAAPELWSAQPLVGDEPIVVLGVKPEGPWCFRLPAWRPRMLVARGGTMTEHLPHLDTLLIDADHSRVELVWRHTIGIAEHDPHFERVYVVDDGEEHLAALTSHLA